MPLNSDIKFQKALALAASASNSFEAEAAELAARRLMVAYNIDPTDIPDRSLYSRINFADNALLQKLRDEWREQHPVVVKEKKEAVGQPRLDSSPFIPFSLKGFRKTANKNRRHGGAGEPRDEVRIEMLRVLLNSGKSRSAICREDGFNQGEISGIVRDYSGGKSAAQQYQDNPKWIKCLKDGRVFYELCPVAGNADNAEAVATDGAQAGDHQGRASGG